jgi:hypothetical protein
MHGVEESHEKTDKTSSMCKEVFPSKTRTKGNLKNDGRYEEKV